MAPTRETMGDFDNHQLLFENYKSFGPGLVGFETVFPVNVIVGRNNSGKSALLDLIEFACEPGAGIPGHLHHRGQPSRVILSSILDENAVAPVFDRNTSGGQLRGNHWESGKRLIGARMQIELKGKGKNFVTVDPNIDDHFAAPARAHYQKVAERIKNPFEGKLFYKLSAERDIVNEGHLGKLFIEKNGRGFTSTVSQILNRFEYPTELVADQLLAALNAVFSPDATFTSIDVQQHGESGPWEIFLNETGKGRVGLTHSGSGLKTVLLAAAYFLLLPRINNKKLSDFIFAFEELENNLHPALQRRLLKFVTASAKNNGTALFLTTHSNVVIDLFSQDKDAQILHVTQTNGTSKIRQVQTYIENRGVLDDLDVRASDLLQANGVVWVEGPSDRLYFNRWIELVTDGEMKEGSHYQCVFYGGRLLAHLSAELPDIAVDEVVKILRVNRNALILIDSDKDKSEDQLNTTKKRIVSEIEKLKGMAWVTQGREVENYLPLAAIQNKIANATELPGEFEDFVEYLERIEAGTGKRFARNKVMFAEMMIPAFTKENIACQLDLNDRLTTAVAMIRKWNGS